MDLQGIAIVSVSAIITLACIANFFWIENTATGKTKIIKDILAILLTITSGLVLCLQLFFPVLLSQFKDVIFAICLGVATEIILGVFARAFIDIQRGIFDFQSIIYDTLLFKLPHSGSGLPGPIFSVFVSVCSAGIAFLVHDIPTSTSILSIVVHVRVIANLLYTLCMCMHLDLFLSFIFLINTICLGILILTPLLFVHLAWQYILLSLLAITIGLFSYQKSFD